MGERFKENEQSRRKIWLIKNLYAQVPCYTKMLAVSEGLFSFTCCKDNSKGKVSSFTTIYVLLLSHFLFWGYGPVKYDHL